MKLKLSPANAEYVAERAQNEERSKTYALNAILREWREELKSGAKMPRVKAKPMTPKQQANNRRKRQIQ